MQLLEEMTDAYQVSARGDRVAVDLEPSDLFTSTTDASSGRLDVKRATGTLTISVSYDDGNSGHLRG